MAHSLLDMSQGRRTHGLELPPPCQIEEGEVHGEVHIEWDRSSLSFVDRAKQLGGNRGGKSQLVAVMCIRSSRPEKIPLCAGCETFPATLGFPLLESCGEQLGEA